MTVEQFERPVTAIVRVGCGVAVVGITSWVAVQELPDWERSLFEFLNGGPGALEPFLWVPMQLGSLFGPALVGAGAWLKWNRWRPALGAVVAGLVAWNLAKVLKAAIERGRPFEMVEEFARLSGTPYEGLGFVSGHSAVAFSLAAVLSPYLSRPARIAAYAIAGVVGLARIHVSAHLPLDVVGGAALGYAVGWTWHVAVGLPRHVRAGSGEGAPQDAQS